MSAKHSAPALTSSEMYVAHGLVEAYRRGIVAGAIPTDSVGNEIAEIEQLSLWIQPLLEAGHRITTDEWSGVLDYELFDAGDAGSVSARMYDRAVMLSVLRFPPSAEAAEALVRGVLGEADHQGIAAAGARMFLTSASTEPCWTDRVNGRVARVGIWSDEGGAVRVAVESLQRESGEVGDGGVEMASESLNTVAEVEEFVAFGSAVGASPGAVGGASSPSCG
ncbi:hypothetical protein [Dolichospermum phage Dfl-JY45]